MSYITSPMFAIQVLLVVFIGWFAKYVVKERPYDLSKTAIRKIFQGVANGGMAFFLILLTFNDCNLIYVALMLQVVSFLSMFTAGGETMLPYDLSEKYPATIMAIANSFANLSGVTTTEISRFVLGSQAASFHRWNILIYMVAGANIVGCLAFSILVEAEPIDFEKKKRPNRASDIDLEESTPTASQLQSDNVHTEREVREDRVSTLEAPETGRIEGEKGGLEEIKEEVVEENPDGTPEREPEKASGKEKKEI